MHFDSADLISRKGLYIMALVLSLKSMIWAIFQCFGKVFHEIIVQEIVFLNHM